MQAGHFKAAGSSENLRFSEINLHAQCTGCNKDLYGNLKVYAEKMKIRYGPDIITILTREQKVVKQWTVPELEILINHYKKLNAKS